MTFTQYELELLDVLKRRRGAQSLALTIKRMAGSLGLDVSGTGIAWVGLVEKGKLRRITDDTAEIIA